MGSIATVTLVYLWLSWLFIKAKSHISYEIQIESFSRDTLVLLKPKELLHGRRGLHSLSVPFLFTYSLTIGIAELLLLMFSCIIAPSFSIS